MKPKLLKLIKSFYLSLVICLIIGFAIAFYMIISKTENGQSIFWVAVSILTLIIFIFDKDL